VTRRPVRGLAPIEAAPVKPRPPGPATILGPDGRTWHRDEDGLYYDEHRREVFSQAALRDLIERAGERLAREVRRSDADPVVVAIARARTVTELNNVWHGRVTAWTEEQAAAARGRRAVLELPPKEDT
jgi:hypothetical protein